MRYPLIDGEIITAEETAAFYEWRAANSEMDTPPGKYDPEPVPFDWDRYISAYHYMTAAQSVYDTTQNL